VPRITKAKSDRRREQREPAAAIERARLEIAAAKAIQHDELATGRDFETGSVVYASPTPSGVIDSPDPLAGLKANRDRLSDRYDKKAADQKFAGAKASAGAHRNLDHAYAELVAANERLDEREAAMIEAGNLLECASCGRDFHRGESSFPDLCGPCERAWRFPTTKGT
jgi:hypothetical protein